MGYTIVLDFDGTLLPSDPFDSEHTLLLYNMHALEDRPTLIKRMVGGIIIFLDMKKWLGPSFKTYYAWVLSGTPISRLHEVSRILSQKIGDPDRKALWRLHRDGHTLMINSCGTLDLIERILELAGIKECFKNVYGNPILSTRGRIKGIKRRIVYPINKIKPLKEAKITPDRLVAVGDGYTDLPLLDWANFPVLMNRSGKREKRLAKKGYPEIASIRDLADLIDRLPMDKKRI